MKEAKKFDGKKANMALLPKEPIIEVTKVFEFGGKKYGMHNWRQGMAWSRLVSATMRHLLAWNEGEEKDPESDLSHLAHAACNLLFLIEYQLHSLGTDDRFKRSNIQVLEKPPVTHSPGTAEHISDAGVKRRGYDG